VEDHHASWLRFLHWLGLMTEQKPVLFCTSDDHLLFLSRNRAAVEETFRFLIPPQTTVESVINKRTQYCTAEKAGIPIPKTVYPESIADVRLYSADLAYPCILKPYTYLGRSAVGKKAIIVRSPTELLESFERISQTGQPFMIQEIVPGDRRALFAYHGIWDDNGREIAWWTKQHLRGIPFGDGSYHVTVEAPEIADLSRRLLAAFDYKGCSHVEFKLDPRDQTYRLIEINARTGLSTQQGISAGVDLPWIGYQYLTGGSSERLTSNAFARGVTYVNEPVDIYVFVSLWKVGHISFFCWLRSFLSARAKGVWAWDDPWPLFAVGWSMVKHGLRRAVGSLRSEKGKAESIIGEFTAHQTSSPSVDHVASEKSSGPRSKQAI
jgi:predicted ATP-grasp superfamily ATP-dependent carboligase